MKKILRNTLIITCIILLVILAIHVTRINLAKKKIKQLNEICEISIYYDDGIRYDTASKKEKYWLISLEKKELYTIEGIHISTIHLEDDRINKFLDNFRNGYLPSLNKYPKYNKTFTLNEASNHYVVTYNGQTRFLNSLW